MICAVYKYTFIHSFWSRALWGHFLAAKLYFQCTKKWTRRTRQALRLIISHFKYPYQPENTKKNSCHRHFKSLNFEYITVQLQLDLPPSLLDKLFAVKNLVVSESHECLTHFPYYICRDNSSNNVIIIVIGMYCANINPGK